MGLEKCHIFTNGSLTIHKSLPAVKTTAEQYAPFKLPINSNHQFSICLRFSL
jgi:hypothetical protein